jgi:DNA-binding NarL/FixJ family response regulator
MHLKGTKMTELNSESPYKEADATNVFLVDDHPVVRQGLYRLINQEPNLTVCGDADNVNTAIDDIKRLNPDIAIIDLSLGKESGFTLIKEIRKDHEDMPILVLSIHDESHYAERTIKMGVQGYIMKNTASENIIEAIKAIMQGDVYLSTAMQKQVIKNISSKHKDGYTPSIDSLSTRELEVFKLVGKGLSVQNIARTMKLSSKTIETYCLNIRKKMNLKSLHELMVQAIKMSEE